MWEAWCWSLGWEDPLQKGMATHSGLGKCHGQRGLAGHNPWGRKSQTQCSDWTTATNHLHCGSSPEVSTIMLGTEQEAFLSRVWGNILSPSSWCKVGRDPKTSMRTPSGLQPGNAEPLAAETGAGNIFMTSSLRAISVLAIICLGLDFHRIQQQVLYRQHRTKSLARVWGNNQQLKISCGVRLTQNDFLRAAAAKSL